MIDPALRKQFEQNGVEVVRAEMCGNNLWTPEVRSAAREWVSEQDKLREQARSTLAAATLCWAKVGGVAAIVAAAASILGLFSKGH